MTTLRLSMASLLAMSVLLGSTALAEDPKPRPFPTAEEQAERCRAAAAQFGHDPSTCDQMGSPGVVGRLRPDSPAASPGTGQSLGSKKESRPTVRWDVSTADEATRAALDKALRAKREQLKYCYELGLSTDANAAGELSLAVSVDASKAVSVSEAEAATMKHPQIVRCVLARTRAILGGQLAAGASASLKLVFSLTQAKAAAPLGANAR